MSSWFSSGLDKLKEVSNKVRDAVPIDKEMIAKLTLNTDEMKAEREQFGEEQKRRDMAKDSLSGMLPWETRDPERDILVEECKEAILALSSDPKTFFGPYEVPPLPVKDITPSNSREDRIDFESEDADDDAAVGGTDADAIGGDDEEEHHVEAPPKSMKPTPESLEMLAKLEPLPPLLAVFDLDSHVGLIQKTLKEDPKLVEMQSHLSGGGEREKVFWHNYFFHCAYTRYEAGLSIDEIWSDEPIDSKPAVSADDAGVDATVMSSSGPEAGGEKSAMYENTGASGAAVEDIQADRSPSSGDFIESKEGAVPSADHDVSPPNSETNDFELVDEAGSDAGDNGELDELEAEIARELEGL